MQLDTSQTSIPFAEDFELKVLASFPLVMKVHLRVPRDARNAQAAGKVKTDDPLYNTFNAVTVNFGPYIVELSDFLGDFVDCNRGFTHLYHMLHLSEIDRKAPIFEECDIDDRSDILTKFAKNSFAHYILLNDGVEMIVFGNNGVPFPPGRSFRSPTKRVHKKGILKGKVKPASQSERSAATYRLKLITYFPPSAIARYGLKEDPSGSHEEYSQILLSDERFNQRQIVDYNVVTRWEVGHLINPKRPLTAAFDPKFSFLKKNRNGQNVLTNFHDISIPLFWPDWSDERLEDLKMLESWGPNSYEALVRFLTGMKVDSLEDFVASERLKTEDFPKERGVSKKQLQSDRDGQCYRGSFHKLNIVGPYCLFELRLNGKSLFLLDSPFYGVALRAFEEKQFALDYIAGGDRRERANHHVLWRLVHDKIGNWKMQLKNNLREFEGHSLPVLTQ